MPTLRPHLDQPEHHSEACSSDPGEAVLIQKTVMNLSAIVKGDERENGAIYLEFTGWVGLHFFKARERCQLEAWTP